MSVLNVPKLKDGLHLVGQLDGKVLLPSVTHPMSKRKIFGR